MAVASDAGLWSALALSAVAGVTDWRRGTIPNWLTLPPLLAFPLFYGAVLGPTAGAQSIFSLLACGFVPYWLFRHGGMGGGDVKLFASLGAATGFDPMLGIRIELGAFVAATLLAILPLLRGGHLAATLRRSGLAATQMLGLRKEVGSAPTGPCIRMGAPIFAATCISCAPLLSSFWSIA
jgi:prepilin peptidase CpaA